MWRIRESFRSIKNLIVWFPVIWKDRQWDSWYIEELLLKKITLIRDSTQERQFYVGWENEVKWMNKCIYLLTMLTESKYWEDEYDGKIPSNNGLSSASIKTIQFYQSSVPSVNYYGDYWEEKARRLFWKIFIWRYEYWWD